MRRALSPTLSASPVSCSAIHSPCTYVEPIATIRPAPKCWATMGFGALVAPMSPTNTAE
jgi:hypothetical protein